MQKEYSTSLDSMQNTFEWLCCLYYRFITGIISKPHVSSSEYSVKSLNCIDSEFYNILGNEGFGTELVHHTPMSPMSLILSDLKMVYTYK